MPVAVQFVVTEHPRAVTTARREHYERIRLRLERISGHAVRTLSYPDVASLEGATAVVLSGSFAPWAVHDRAALTRLGEVVRTYTGPVLGICAGVQLLATFAGGSVGKAAATIESGFFPVEVVDDSDLLGGLGRDVTVYHHHSDEITSLPEDFRVLASTPWCRVEAIADRSRQWWGTQFHPEEFTTAHPDGEGVLRNFFRLADLPTPADG